MYSNQKSLVNYIRTFLVCTLLLSPIYAQKTHLISWDSLQTLYKCQHHEEAYHHIQERLKIYPLETRSLLMLAGMTQEGFQVEDLLLSVPAESLSRQDGETLYRLGQWYFAAGKYPLAIENFSKLTKLVPKGKYTSAALNGWGHSLLLQYRDTLADSAEQLFLLQLARHKVGEPSYAFALEGIAKARLAQKIPASAKDALEMALETAPVEQKPALYLLLYQAARMSRDAVGRDIYKKTLLTDYPYSPEAQSLLKSGAATTNTSANIGTSTIAPTPRDTTPITLTPPVINTSDTAHLQTANDTAAKNQTITNRNNTEAVIPKGFFLQLGSFLSDANASRRAEELVRAGIPAKPVLKTEKGAAKWLVVVGPYSTRAMAEKFAVDSLAPKEIPFYILTNN